MKTFTLNSIIYLTLVSSIMTYAVTLIPTVQPEYDPLVLLAGNLQVVMMLIVCKIINNYIYIGR